jgi:hypothetical protein
MANPFGPRDISLQDIGINSLWALIAGIIGSVVVLLIMFLFWNIFNIAGNFSNEQLGGASNTMYPFTLSLVAFIGTSITVFGTYIFSTITQSERYKRSTIIFGQMAFFSILTYLFLTPIYIYTGVISYTNIMFVFLGHILFLTFWTSILLEILNNYRHILTGIYWSFIGLFMSIIITFLIFFSLPTGYAKLLSLLFFLPLVSVSMTFCKHIFEYLYFKYNRATNLDPLWDIFYQLEMEEKETQREELQKESIE